ncbi:MAG: glycosyltransferase family A protein, partial [Ignavibacteriaceae bacterium]
MNYIIVTNSIDRTSELVSRSLRASLNQKLPPLKVILIDQREIPLSLPEDITGHSLFERQLVKQKSVSSARNSLRIPGEADWIFFCDDDGFPCNDYSEKLQKIILGNPQLEIIAGSIVREDNNEFYSLRHKKGGSLKYFRNTKNLMGSNFVVKVKTFNDLGRFDENFGAGSYWGSSEETDFCWKAYFAEKNLEFLHQTREDFAELGSHQPGGDLHHLHSLTSLAAYVLVSGGGIERDGQVGHPQGILSLFADDLGIGRHATAQRQIGGVAFDGDAIGHDARIDIGQRRDGDDRAGEHLPRKGVQGNVYRLTDVHPADVGLVPTAPGIT